MSGGGWGPALRIAWRTARHHRGRTALVAVLVALPVLVGGFLDVVARTAQLPAEEKVRRFMGSADAYVEFAGWCGPITQIVYSDNYPSATENYGCERAEPPPVPDIPALLPEGSVAVPRYPSFESYLHRVLAGERSARFTLQEFDVASPLFDGIIRLVSGRLPESSGEVLASPGALDRLDAAIGDSIIVGEGATVTIVGSHIDPEVLNWPTIIGPRGWTGLPHSESDEGAIDGVYLVDLPDDVDVLALQRELMAHGVLLAPREHVLDPPPDQAVSYQSYVDWATIGLIVLAVGFGLLEVMLLAGTAFAVSARRQVRDLGLVAATGGEARHVRRIVLAQGVVIGLVGAAVAIPLAIAGVFFGRRWLEPVNGALMGPLDVRPVELAALVAVGVVSGLAAALVPAVATARLPVLDALNKRFKSTSLRARWPRVGLAMLILGVAVSAVGAGLWRRSQLSYAAELEKYVRIVASGQTAPVDPQPPNDALLFALMLVGFALVAFGLALNASALVAAVARIGRWLPLSARLALRDAGRHRHRTGPAVAAIMTAVAGSVGLAFYILSDDTESERQHHWGLRLGQAQLVYQADLAASEAETIFLDAARAASEELPATAVVPIRTVGGNIEDPEAWTYAYAFETQPGCAGPERAGASPDIGVGDGSMLALNGEVPDSARRALQEGKAVVTSCQFFSDGEITLTVGDQSGERQVTLPAVYSASDGGLLLPSVVISAETAGELGLPTLLSSVVIDTGRVPTRDEEDRAAEVLDREISANAGGQLWVERGYQGDTSIAFLALVGGSAFVTLVGTAIAVALAAAESRADHATLLAVGAQPRRRRFLAMGQAATVSVLGVGLGVVLGTIVGASILGGHEALPFVVPWMTLAQIAVGIPLVGVLIAGLFTRSRLPLDRRLG